MRFGEKEPNSSFCFMKLDLLLPFKSLFFVLTLVIINIRIIGYGNLPEFTPTSFFLFFSLSISLFSSTPLLAFIAFENVNT